jgi:amidohydrolase
MSNTGLDAQGWLTDAEAVQADTVRLRRAIHEEPELGLETPKTLAKVKAALAGLPLEWKEGPSCTGAVAILRGARSGRTVLLRGDMDALPMAESTGLEFSSRVEGAMHACGHDAHTAMLASAARILCARRSELSGTVMFMFQPGEEGWHGAKKMIDDGLLDDPTPNAAFALHVFPNRPAGVFSGKGGPMLASGDEVHVTVRGKGGHASRPHDTVDPVPVACEIVTALQVFVTRRINIFDPVVLTFGRIEAGSTCNVTPESARLLGTVRSLSEESRDVIHAGIAQVATNVARAHGCEADVHIERMYPVTVCDARATAHAAATVATTFGSDAWTDMGAPVMGAEDFSYVLQKVPGAMVFLGVCPADQSWQSACPNHSNKMVLNEAVLARGVAAHCAIAERFLATGMPA